MSRVLVAAWLVVCSLPAVGAELAPEDFESIRLLAETCEKQEREEPAKWAATGEGFKLYCTQARLVVMTRIAEGTMAAYRAHLAQCPLVGQDHQHGPPVSPEEDGAPR